MNIPFMNVIPSVSDRIDIFKGYNRNERIADNEFSDMLNMSSDKYPLLAPRNLRSIENINLSGVVLSVKSVNNELYAIVVDESALKIYKKDGSKWVVAAEFGTNYGATTTRNVVVMGSKIIIFPDNVYYNTIATIGEDEPDRPIGARKHESGKLDAITETKKNDDNNCAIFSLCKKDGTGISYTTDKPGVPNENDYWLDGSGSDAQLKKWSGETWVTEPTTFTKIKLPIINDKFIEGDGVKISYYPNQIEQPIPTETSVILEKVYDDTDGYGDYFVVRGILDYIEDEKYYCKIERTVPAMDFVIECNNRLWGCRSGYNENNHIVNEIYASALGDPTNWNIFEGTSMDSYVMSLGSNGEFTGAIAHRGYPLFFKENYIHKIYGTSPSSFQLQTVEAPGVQKGSSKSLAVLNEVLYYKAEDSVYAYESSLPVNIGAALGKKRLYSCKAIGHNNKYYMFAYSEPFNKGAYLFVYDTTLGMWHKEELSSWMDAFTKTEDVGIVVLENNEYKLLYEKGSTADKEELFDWHAESGILGLAYNESKKLRKFTVRMTVPYGSRVKILVEYDSSGRWEQVFSKTGTSLKAIEIPILAKKCDHFRIRFEGNGEAKIYSITKTFTKGSVKR